MSSLNHDFNPSRADAPESLDIAKVLSSLWRWKLLLLAFVILPPLAAYLYERGKPKIYASSALVSLQGPTVSTSAGTNALNVAVAARLISLPPIPEQAARLLRAQRGTGYLFRGVSPEVLASEVSASTDSSTDFLTIATQDRNPLRAALIADAFAQTELQDLQRAGLNSLDSQIRQLQLQLASLPVTDLTDRTTVGEQIANLSAQRTVGVSNGRLLEHAAVNNSPISPKVSKAVALALVAGLLLGLGAVAVMETTRRKFRNSDELEAGTNLPTLGLIPRRAFSQSNGHDPSCEEAFQMLRATIAYSVPDRLVTSLAMVSPSPGDGKTTIAIGLARAAANAGMRVILVDADLHRSQLSARLGVRSDAGLTSVLLSAKDLDEVLVEPGESFGTNGNLRILPGGAEAPSPAALIASPRMQQILRSCEAKADLVIVDTPAALASSDALPLANGVSATAMVVRLGRTSAPSVHRLKKMMASSNSRLIGTVAVGGSRQGQPYYHYGYGAKKSVFWWRNRR